MPSLVDECILGKNKFKNFLEVVEDCGIKTGYDFTHFMSITKEHCTDKGITDYDEVKKIWEEHKDSVVRAVDWVKDYDNLPDDLYYKDKRYLGRLYIDPDVRFGDDDDDDIGDWRENTVFTEEVDQERVEACKEIFEGVGKIEVKVEDNHDKS